MLLSCKKKQTHLITHSLTHSLGQRQTNETAVFQSDLVFHTIEHVGQVPLKIYRQINYYWYYYYAEGKISVCGAKHFCCSTTCIHVHVTVFLSFVIVTL